METKFKRQLAAIVFTDIVGYTHLMHINEDRALLLRSRHRSVLLALHEKYGGEVLQFFGDGTLSIFNSSVKAVECAVEMQLEYRKDPEVPVRIGIHVGDISYDGTDAFGDGLNVAARIEPLCEPGGVYVSERVYEDIRNHAWLKTVHVGNFLLKNISGETPLYGISSKGMALPLPRSLQIPARHHLRNQQGQQTTFPEQTFAGGGKSRKVAGVLALTLGMWGAHDFYLGKKFLGILRFLAFFLVLWLTVQYHAGALFAPLAILAFIEAILFFVMPDAEFDAKYNNGIPAERKEKKKSAKTEKKRTGEGQQARKSRGNHLIKDGFIAYKGGDYEQARKSFEDALQYDYNDPQTHFMLSCCYSLAKDSRQAYFHLASAVDFGFQEFEEIYNNEALIWLRSQPDFDSFVQNGYRQTAHLATPQPDLLEEKSYYDMSLLDRIADLGELLERGVITKEDFELQKKELLGH
ncbi:MAG TPA: adenylate/guanylate cyclase domain-containing protein [Chitinophagaceae bacterium]|nr:adenylate/guanylate cyclase domain-containing protein [Chitinophagaceae bacterium]